jgi:hypothetical protein
MGRKPLLGLAGVLLTGMALAGCQNNPTSPPKAFAPDRAGISQNMQTTNKNGTPVVNNGLTGGGAQNFNNTTTPPGGAPYQVPNDPRPANGTTGFGAPSPASLPYGGNGQGVPAGVGQPISNSNFNSPAMNPAAVPTYPNLAPQTASPPPLRGNSMGTNTYSTAPPVVPAPLDRPPGPPPSSTFGGN